MTAEGVRLIRDFLQVVGVWCSFNFEITGFLLASRWRHRPMHTNGDRRLGPLGPLD